MFCCSVRGHSFTCRIQSFCTYLPCTCEPSIVWIFIWQWPIQLYQAMCQSEYRVTHRQYTVWWCSSVYIDTTLWCCFLIINTIHLCNASALTLSPFCVCMSLWICIKNISVGKMRTITCMHAYTGVRWVMLCRFFLVPLMLLPSFEWRPQCIPINTFLHYWTTVFMLSLFSFFALQFFFSFVCVFIWINYSSWTSVKWLFRIGDSIRSK